MNQEICGLTCRPPQSAVTGDKVTRHILKYIALAGTFVKISRYLFVAERETIIHAVEGTFERHRQYFNPFVNDY